MTIQIDVSAAPEAILPPHHLAELPVVERLRAARLDGEGSLTSQVYRMLRTLIVNLHLMPNQALPEKEVAAVLTISKTPVREAFIRLAEDGLVSIVPKIGTYVAPIDIKRALRGYFIRESLESACVERIAMEGKDEDFACLDAELEKQKAAIESGGFDTFYLLDNTYHSLLYDLARMPSARRLVESAKSEVDRLKGLKSVYRFCRPESVLLGEHTEIRNAARNGDGPRARRAIKNHLSGMNEAIEAVLKEEKLWGLFNRINRGTGQKW